MTLTIAELPFHERPVLELLALEDERDVPLQDYGGYGWAHVPRVWLGHDPEDPSAGRFVDDALVLALHTPDDAGPIAGELELELELPGGGSVLVMLSTFLATWLPTLPPTAAIVLAVCNPHRATLRRPPTCAVPVHYPLGDVTSWIDRDRGDRIDLIADRWLEG